MIFDIVFGFSDPTLGLEIFVVCHEKRFRKTSEIGVFLYLYSYWKTSFSVVKKWFFPKTNPTSIWSKLRKESESDVENHFRTLFPSQTMTFKK